MYLKWIVCKVENELKNEFSKAQEKWVKIKNAEGFIGQIGGWNLLNRNEACILSYWKDRNSLINFMKNIHDKIFNDNQQKNTYNSISIHYFNLKINIPGIENILNNRLRNGMLLGITDCKVKSKKIYHFENNQNLLRQSAMKKATDILGGEFSVDEKDKAQYLISTLWNSLESHSDHTKYHLQILQRIFDVNSDLIQTNKSIFF